MEGWDIQIASDIIRDGLGVELLDGKGDIAAEIFRCDADHTIILSTFNHDVPLAVIEWFIEVARQRLEAFEDGTPLPPRGQEGPNQRHPLDAQKDARK